jgi:hypothetical protein
MGIKTRHLYDNADFAAGGGTGRFPRKPVKINGIGAEKGWPAQVRFYVNYICKPFGKAEKR